MRIAKSIAPNATLTGIVDQYGTSDQYITVNAPGFNINLKVDNNVLLDPDWLKSVRDEIRGIGEDGPKPLVMASEDQYNHYFGEAKKMIAQHPVLSTQSTLMLYNTVAETLANRDGLTLYSKSVGSVPYVPAELQTDSDGNTASENTRYEKSSEPYEEDEEYDEDEDEDVWDDGDDEDCDEDDDNY